MAPSQCNKAYFSVTSLVLLDRLPTKGLVDSVRVVGPVGMRSLCVISMRLRILRIEIICFPDCLIDADVWCDLRKLREKTSSELGCRDSLSFLRLEIIFMQCLLWTSS